jgi:hypothetical protein
MFNEPDQGYFVLPIFLECGFHIRYSKGLVLAPTAKSANGYRWVGLVTDQELGTTNHKDRLIRFIKTWPYSLGSLWNVTYYNNSFNNCRM